MRRFLGAVQFLTVVPVTCRTEPPARCVVFYPVVGALLGAVAGLVAWGLAFIFPNQFASLAAIGTLALLTGCLHEDGLADAADAFRAQRTPEKIREILKDSRIGSFGAVAVVFSVALRWQALVAVSANPVVALAVSGAVSRAAVVALAWFGKPFPEGLAAEFRRDLSAAAIAGAMLLGAGAALCAGPWRGAAIVLANLLLVAGARHYFHKRAGGLNGDCLGATAQCSEFVNLALLAWRNSSL